MKIFQLFLVIIISQSACFAYTSPIINQKLYNQAYRQALYNKALYNRGVMTGIPVPIFATPVEQIQQPVKRKHIKKKYRKYYPEESNNTFTIIEY